MRARLSRWWFNATQRGIFMRCYPGSVWCVVDNIAHIAYRHRLILRRRTGWRWLCPTVPQPFSWVCNKHEQAITGEWPDD